ncbi:WbqC family protein [Actinoallomurus purpureus]|uniref:WbqC family protein n=1 Tax=Actinoallomurus purpureus TaxID=478114 RepID=UPI002092452D|nr:WbqC family protein [Actinoallomurus purpureus]MCO6008566.1 WbqC family protein [Actinoallomurus purpureus]
MKRIAIVQSNYIPWKGYFDMIAHIDEFILLDDVQYTDRDWRNRNRIKTATGLKWLSIPVKHGPRSQLINEVTVSDLDWHIAHWQILTQTYRKTPFFDEVAPILEDLYQKCGSNKLSEINRHFLEGIFPIFGIQANLSRSEDYGAAGAKTERLLDLCQKAGADQYVTGPAARAYLDESLFRKAGIEVRWFDYSGYPEYPQLHPPFDHHVTVLDLIFNTGPAAAGYLKGVVRAAKADSE